MSLIDDIKTLYGNLLPDNDNNEISPEDLRDSLDLILDNLTNIGSNYYGAIVPGSPVIVGVEENATVLPLEDGIYSNFGGLKKDNELCVFVYESATWVKKSFDEFKLRENLKSLGESIIADRLNYFDKDSVVSGELVSASGQDVDVQSLVGFDRSDYILLKEGEEYTLQGFTINSNLLFAGVFKTLDPEEVGVRINDNTFTMPVGYKYFVFSVKSTSQTVDLNTIQLEKGAVSTDIVDYAGKIIPESYLEFIKTKPKNLIKGIKQDQVISFGSHKSESEKYSSLENVTILSGWSFSGFMEIKEGVDYVLKGLTLSNNQAGGFFDENFDPIGETFVATDTNTYVSILKGSKFTAPIGAKYFAFNIDKPTRQLNTDILSFEEYDEQDKEVNIQNSDYIAIYGNSYTASFYAIFGKSWMRKLSNFIDYPLCNFGESGNSFVDIIERMRLGENPFWSNAPLEAISPKYCILALIANERINSQRGNDHLFYSREVEEVVNTAKSYGMFPILGTDHKINRPENDVTLHEDARKNNIPYFPFGSNGRVINREDYAEFWNGGHPGTRTNTWTTLQWANFFETMPRPTKSTKIFRLRSNSNSKPISELNFNNNYQRAENWQEISNGEQYLINGDTVYDRIGTSYAGSNDFNNEYGMLMTQFHIPMTFKYLVEFTTSVLKARKGLVTILTDTAPQNVYIKDSMGIIDESYTLSDYRNNVAYEVSEAVYNSFVDVVGTTGYTDANLPAVTLTFAGKLKSYSLKNDSGYYLFFTGTTLSADLGSGTIVKGVDNYSYLNAYRDISQQPIKFYTNKFSGELREIPFNYSNGALTFEVEKLYEVMDFDKLSVIINSTLAPEISYAKLDVIGGINKTLELPKYNALLRSNTLYATKGFDVLGDWTTTGSLEAIPEPYTDYPSSPAINQHVRLEWDSDNFPHVLKRNIAWTESGGYQKLKVRVVARVFPLIYTGVDDTWTTDSQLITDDTYDFARLCVSLKLNSGFNGSFQSKQISFGWMEQIFEILVPAYESAGELIIFRHEDDYGSQTSNYPMQIHSVTIENE